MRGSHATSFPLCLETRSRWAQTPEWLVLAQANNCWRCTETERWGLKQPQEKTTGHNQKSIVQVSITIQCVKIIILLLTSLISFQTRNTS